MGLKTEKIGSVGMSVRISVRIGDSAPAPELGLTSAAPSLKSGGAGGGAGPD